jgi:electron transfer flavoprotein alpha subunit
MSAILVLVDHLEGEVSDLSYEMIGAARNIAGPLRAPVVAAVLGHDAGTVAAKCGGADVVLTVESASLDVPTIETTGTVLKQVMEQRQATIALIGGSNLAWGIGAKLAALTGMPYVNFCKGLKVESDAVLVTSQLYGGKILTEESYAFPRVHSRSRPTRARAHPRSRQSQYGCPALRLSSASS